MWLFFSRKARRRSPASRPRVEALEHRCLLSAGALDPTFGSGGLVTTVPGSGGLPQAMAIQSNGDIVVAGWAKDPRTGLQDFSVARYNLDGTLDTTFGNGGIVLTPIGRINSTGNALAIQPDGKILVGGYSSYYGAKQQVYGEAALVRYNANGTLDSTFGGSKTPGIALSTTAQPINCMALEANGEIAAAGTNQVALFTSRGSLDTSFGQGGVALLSGLSGLSVNAIAVQPTDGKIVTTGAAQAANGTRPDFLARLNPNGSLDSTFGSGGYVSQQFSPVTPLSSWTATIAHSLLIQPDGKLVTAGFVQVSYNADGRQYGLFLARLNSDGSPDLGFGSGGSVISTALDGGQGHAGMVARQADGSLVVAGVQDAGPGGLATSRYTASGQLDTTWGANGVSDVYVSGRAIACALEPSGALVVLGAGNVNISGPPCTFLARFLPSEPEIGSFTASPNPVTSGGTTTLTVSNITDGNPGVSIAQVAFYLDSNGDGQLEPGTDTLVGYATQTSPGVWPFTLSTAGWATGNYTLFTQAQDSYGVFGDPVALSLQVL
jgi:uncharacterized delta-60 repeat protein